MAKDPAFLFYSKDWLQGTAQMSAEEKGVYTDLLAHQHQDGYLPSDIKRLARISHMANDDFARIWEYLKDKFQEENGKLINKKLLEVVDNRSVHSEVRTINGTFGAILRSLDATENVKSLIRKDFKVKDFSEAYNSNRKELSNLLSKWVSKRLAKHGNGTENGNGIINENIIDNKLWFLKFYHSNYSSYKSAFNGQSTTEAHFKEWKKFIDFIYEKNYVDLFEAKFVSPHDFSKLLTTNNFTSDKWDETLKKILATGIQPNHNLFFRIPQFMEYGKKKDQKEDVKDVKIKLR